MKNLLEPLKAYLKKVFSDLHSAIVGTIVAALILSGGSIYIFAQSLWLQLKTLAQTPTPLWATIALVLVLMARRFLKSPKNPININHTSEKPPSCGEKLKLSEMHEKILELLFQKPANIEDVCKTFKLNREESNYYLYDLYNKEMAYPRIKKLSLLKNN